MQVRQRRLLTQIRAWSTAPEIAKRDKRRNANSSFHRGIARPVCVRSAISTACRHRPMFSYLPLL